MTHMDASQDGLLLRYRQSSEEHGTATHSHGDEEKDEGMEADQNRRSSLQLLASWYLPIVHTCYTLLLTAGIIFWLNGKTFTTSNSTDNERRLSQTNITTIVSTCLVLGRFVVGAWQTLAAWRCAFILNEKTEISMNDISWIVSWCLPSRSIFRPKVSKNGATVTKYTAVLVLVLLWPAQLINPVASGSISWIPTTSYAALEPTPAIGVAIVAKPWTWYVKFPSTRKRLVKRSAGLASLARDIPGDKPEALWTTPPSQRMETQFSAYPDGTLVESATIPVFNILSFEWITDTTKLPKDILSAVRNIRSGYLNISESTSPLSQDVIGNDALLKGRAWQKPSIDRLPEPHTFIGNVFAALFVSREPNYGRGASHTCQTATSDFGAFPAQLINVQNWSNYSDCIAVARLAVSVGVSHCRQSNTALLSPSGYVVSGPPGVLRAENRTVSPDALVSEVLAMMSEVQAVTSALGLNNQSMLNNSEQYLRNSLTRAYQGTWSALVEFFSDGAHSVETRAREPYQLLQAKVFIWRMCLWMGVNLLAALSGLLLMQMQSTCKEKTVSDPIIAALTMGGFTRTLQSQTSERS